MNFPSLILDRPKSAVPFGGLYRVIHFALNNLTQSRIGRVGILCSTSPPHSLHTSAMGSLGIWSGVIF